MPTPLVMASSRQFLSRGAGHILLALEGVSDEEKEGAIKLRGEQGTRRQAKEEGSKIWRRRACMAIEASEPATSEGTAAWAKALLACAA